MPPSHLLVLERFLVALGHLGAVVRGLARLGRRLQQERRQVLVCLVARPLRILRARERLVDRRYLVHQNLLLALAALLHVSSFNVKIFRMRC